MEQIRIIKRRAKEVRHTLGHGKQRWVMYYYLLCQIGDWQGWIHVNHTAYYAVVVEGEDGGKTGREYATCKDNSR